MLRPRRLPARTRLTLWFLMLLAAALLAVNGATLWAVGRVLYGNADEVLRARAVSIQGNVEVERGRLGLEHLDRGTDLPQLGGLDLVVVYDRDQQPVWRRSGLSALPPAEGLPLAGALTGVSVYSTVQAEAGLRVRLLTEPITRSGQIIGVVQVGRSEQEIEAILGRLGTFGLVGGLAALGLAGVIGYFLAGRALAPVDRITRAAQRISAANLSQRLNLDLPNDELGRLATAFDDLLERLDHGFERQRRFTADASHELRTPLANIRSQIDVALSQPRETDYYERVLGSNREEAERLSRLTDSLLTLARADAGQALTLVQIDLEELVADVAGRLASQARERGLQLDFQLDGSVPVRGDLAWLTQLLLNLLDNALRHTPPGGRITIALEPADGGVELRVSDTGEGIPVEHLPRIFERFYRADPARSRSAGGAGLGLAICAWIAQVNGGRLNVESERGKGTAVTLWLPAAPGAADKATSGYTGPLQRTAPV